MNPVLCTVIGISKDIYKERLRWKDGVDYYGTKVKSRAIATRKRATAHALHTSCDGAGLSDSNSVPMASGCGLMSGKSYTSYTAPL